MPATRPLDPFEVRVLGTLLEKEQTTPDHYPMTINGLINACNQKTNRDPVTNLSETEVVEALDRLRLDVLTWRSEGARAERWEHRLDRRWHLTAPRKAIMTLLLLRGAQTPAELKTRSDRMHSFESVAEVEATLQELTKPGEDRLVRELPRGPGQRENRWIHIVGTEEDLPPAEPEPTAASNEPAAPRGPSGIERIAELEEKVEVLTEELRALRVRLGDLEE